MASDRPLSRSLIRLALRLRHGGRLAHAQDWWPGLVLGPGVRFRGREICPLLPASAVAEAIGEAVTILGSGPSLRGQRVEALEGEAAICLNGAISLRPRLAGPVVLAVEDERFVWRHFPMIRAQLAEGDLCLFSTQVLRALCEIDPGWLAARRVVHVDSLLKPYRAPRRSLAEAAAVAEIAQGEGGVALSRDPARGVIPAGTVAVTALQAALPSARRIGLGGIDLTNAAEPRFYERAGEAAFSGVGRAAERICAHFALARRFAALECYSPVSALLGAGIPFVPRLG